MTPLRSTADTYRIEEFREFMILKNFSKQTIRSYTQAVTQFVCWWLKLPGSIPMSDDVVRKYLLLDNPEHVDPPDAVKMSKKQ